MPAGDDWSGPVLVDAHVHFYGGFDEQRFLDSARRNMAAGAAELGLPPTTPGLLLLAETSRDHAFEAFADRAAGAPPGPWTWRATAEPGSLMARHHGRDSLVLVAGRQIVTREGLEVLALGTAGRFADGESLADTLRRAREADAVPVLPWGFGKWLFRRGALVDDLIRSPGRGGIFLGDNGGRPALAPRPRLLAAAEARGMIVLPGSDPLPLPSRESRAGAYGFCLDGPISRDLPGATLKQRLAALRASPPVYGRLERLAPFLLSQLQMQARKRRTDR